MNKILSSTTYLKMVIDDFFFMSTRDVDGVHNNLFRNFCRKTTDKNHLYKIDHLNHKHFNTLQLPPLFFFWTVLFYHFITRTKLLIGRQPHLLNSLKMLGFWRHFVCFG